MSVALLLAIGLAGYVGVTIGGSSTGVVFGPAVGSNALSRYTGAALMTVFVAIGGWTAGKPVIRTVGTDLVTQSSFPVPVAALLLGLVGTALLLANRAGVPASTSMTVVIAIAGFGVATGSLRWNVITGIASWWLLAPVVGFWSCAVVGRYYYSTLTQSVRIGRATGPLIALDRSGTVPRPRVAPHSTRRETVGRVLVVAIACYMAYAAGASNVANAVGVLVGSNTLSMGVGVLFASATIGLGAFTIATRTIETAGTGLTDLSLLGTLLVEVIGATIITLLSVNGIPASLAVTTTMCVVGLGWGERVVREGGRRLLMLLLLLKRLRRELLHPNSRCTILA